MPRFRGKPGFNRNRDLHRIFSDFVRGVLVPEAEAEAEPARAGAAAAAGTPRSPSVAASTAPRAPPADADADADAGSSSSTTPGGGVFSSRGAFLFAARSYVRSHRRWRPYRVTARALLEGHRAPGETADPPCENELHLLRICKNTLHGLMEEEAREEKADGAGAGPIARVCKAYEACMYDPKKHYWLARKRGGFFATMDPEWKRKRRGEFRKRKREEEEAAAAAAGTPREGGEEEEEEEEDDDEEGGEAGALGTALPRRRDSSSSAVAGAASASAPQGGEEAAEAAEGGGVADAARPPHALLKKKRRLRKSERPCEKLWSRRGPPPRV